MFISPAYAQGGGGGFDLVGIMPLVLIFAVFYFLLIRPQQKKAKAHREMLGAITRGDKIITGGGIIENIPRVLPKDLGIEVDAKAFGYPKIMRWLAKEGRISNFEMAKTFNCGIGMVCIIDQNNLENSISMINSLEEKALILGQVVKNDKQKPVVIKNIETWSLF